VVIFGSAPYKMIQKRVKDNKLTFRYSERPLKTGLEWWRYPDRFLRWHRMYPQRKNVYLLCASAYAASDYAKFLMFKGRSYKWGYFPEVKRYENVDALLEKKTPKSILWAGRFIDWKHPDDVVEVAKRLKAAGYDFHIRMLGNGERWEDVAQMIRDADLEDQIQLVGAVPSDQVRSYMEQASVYLFTSDRNEGWGAVLNESMNSGCAVVACDAIGSVPFLVEDGENGLTYKSGNVDQLYEHVKYLLDHPDICRKLGANAYRTITEKWNAETAARRLLELSEALLRGGETALYEDGPCSKAEILQG
jgi:glycosyltransferase involved in cell wall biosynthesis